MNKFLIVLIFPIAGYSQDILSDNRDNQTYQTTEIAGTIWMTNNLAYKTDLSLSPTSEIINIYNLYGRYYHVDEFEYVCPDGWRIPDVDDWTKYFQFLTSQHVPEVELEISRIEKPIHYTFSNYSDHIDLFAEGNPLNLSPTGRIEGGVQNIPDSYADFWTMDANEEVSGKTHIHIMNPWTTIHSHKHHLQTSKKKKLRFFMVRCVSDL